jgi:hypothetical protein
VAAPALVLLVALFLLVLLALLVLELVLEDVRAHGSRRGSAQAAEHATTSRMRRPGRGTTADQRRAKAAIAVGPRLAAVLAGRAAVVLGLAAMGRAVARLRGRPAVLLGRIGRAAALVVALRRTVRRLLVRRRRAVARLGGVAAVARLGRRLIRGAALVVWRVRGLRGVLLLERGRQHSAEIGRGSEDREGRMRQVRKGARWLRSVVWRIHAGEGQGQGQGGQTC